MKNYQVVLRYPTLLKLRVGQEKMFANHVSDEELISKIHNFYNLVVKKPK